MRGGSSSYRSSLLTIIAVAIAAYATCDMVHEALGHGLVALTIPGVRLLSLSTVALQTSEENRAIAASGAIANVIVGIAALVVFHRLDKFTAGAYFCWLFGSLNLLNGSGYPLYSAVLGSGDWQVVIRGLQPAWLWRIGMGVVGAAGYYGAIVAAARELAHAVGRRLVARAEIGRLVFPSYIAGGVLLTVASIFNPIGPSLILLSGVSSGFAAMAGLTAIPRFVEVRTQGYETGGHVLARGTAWMVTGVVVAVAFVALLGPGIDLTPGDSVLDRVRERQP
jgi:hypothetical protein